MILNAYLHFAEFMNTSMRLAFFRQKVTAKQGIPGNYFFTSEQRLFHQSDFLRNSLSAKPIASKVKKILNKRKHLKQRMIQTKITKKNVKICFSNDQSKASCSEISRENLCVEFSLTHFKVTLLRSLSKICLCELVQ